MVAATTMKGSQNDQESSGHSMDDLPDDLLLHILTFLPFETAWRTRLLSARWRRLPIPLRSVYVNADHFTFSDLRVLVKFLSGHSSMLTSFHLKVTLGNDLQGKLLVMISYIIVVVAVNEVKEACLEIRRRDDPAGSCTLVMYPFVFGSMQRLALTGCAPIHHPAMMPLSLLKCLTLRSISLRQCQLDEALRCCPCLESLRLQQIDGGSPEMQVHAPQIRRLEILESSFVNLEIVAPCLTSLKFDCCRKEEEFKGSVCVSRINAGGCRRLKDLKACSGAILALGREAPQFFELQCIIAQRICSSRNFGLLLDAMAVARPARSLRELGIGKWISFCNSNKAVEAFDIMGMQSVAFHCFLGKEIEFKWLRDMMSFNTPSLQSFIITLASVEDESRFEATMSELRSFQERNPRAAIRDQVRKQCTDYVTARDLECENVARDVQRTVAQHTSKHEENGLPHPPPAPEWHTPLGGGGGGGGGGLQVHPSHHTVPLAPYYYPVATASTGGGFIPPPYTAQTPPVLYQQPYAQYVLPPPPPQAVPQPYAQPSYGGWQPPAYSGYHAPPQSPCPYGQPQYPPPPYGVHYYMNP